MAPFSGASTLLVGSTSLANLSSARHRPPSTAAQREEGWTEVWGIKNCDGDDCKAKNGDNDAGGGSSATAAMEMPYLPPRYVTVMKDGCDYIDGGGKSKSGAVDGKVEDDSPTMLKLTQHRVAWFEQIVLRINHIPHCVENSGYAANESTGGLPCFLDTSPHERKGGDQGKDAVKDDINDDALWEKSFSKLNGPVLLGRNQPGGLGSNFFQQFQRNSTASCFPPSSSHIVDYLRVKHSHTMRDNLLFQEHLSGTKESGDAMAYESLIQDKLNYILLALRYGNDPAWEGVYRLQCIQAALDPNGEYATANGGTRRQSFFPLWAWYQTYSERSLALHNLLPTTHATSPSTHGGLAFELFRYNDYRHSSQSKKVESDEDDDESEEKEIHQHHPLSSYLSSNGGGGGGDSGKVNVYRAMEFADMLYASLEERLSSEVKEKIYFLGTKKPTYIDALLFAHLAEALCDVHLVLVLAKHSRLLKYFQWMYDTYFGEGYAAAWKSKCSGDGVGKSSDSWIKENDVANALNAFNQIPEATASKPTSKGTASVDDRGNDMVHAIQLMQQMAIHCNELDEAIKDATALRTLGGKEEVVLASYHRPVGSLLYKWTTGAGNIFWGSGKRTKSEDIDDTVANNDDDDDVSQSGSGGDKKTSSPEEDDAQRMHREHESRMKRDRRANDELWLSGVAVVVVAALVVSTRR